MAKANLAKVKEQVAKDAKRSMAYELYAQGINEIPYITLHIEAKLNKMITRMEGVAEHTGSPAFIRDLNELRSLRAMIRKEASRAEKAYMALSNWIDTELFGY